MLLVVRVSRMKSAAAAVEAQWPPMRKLTNCKSDTWPVLPVPAISLCRLSWSGWDSMLQLTKRIIRIVPLAPDAILENRVYKRHLATSYTFIKCLCLKLKAMNAKVKMSRLLLWLLNPFSKKTTCLLLKYTYNKRFGKVAMTTYCPVNMLRGKVSSRKWSDEVNDVLDKVFK